MKLRIDWLSSSERWAYIIDLYRLFPRAVLIGYGALVAKIANWFMHLPTPSTEQAAFVTLVCGFFVPLTNWYMQNGVDWEKRRAGTTSTTTATATTTTIAAEPPKQGGPT